MARVDSPAGLTIAIGGLSDQLYSPDLTDYGEGGASIVEVMAHLARSVARLADAVEQLVEAR